jgi:hypothetical protein
LQSAGERGRDTGGVRAHHAVMTIAGHLWKTSGSPAPALDAALGEGSEGTDSTPVEPAI